MINGIINVHKEAGFTSFDVVAKLRGITKQRKIGHTGTLDPDATGVLPVCFGSATKLCEYLTDKTKEYVAEFRLGIVTDTQDISGTVLEEKEVNITKEELIAAINSFIGKQKQIPPMYSAKKVDGKKLCDLAREGKVVERKAADIEIYNIDIVDITIDNAVEAKIRVTCSKGTYIRTLCHDIGQKLGVGATMTSLIRTKSGDFEIGNALTLNEIEKLVHGIKGEDVSKDNNFINNIDGLVTPIDFAFGSYESIVVEDENLRRVLNGNTIKHKKLTEKVRVYDANGEFLALYKYIEEDNLYKAEKMFLT